MKVLRSHSFLVSETNPGKLRNVPQTPGGVYTLHILDFVSGLLLEKWPLEIHRFIAN
jgi:hypothetical protein